MIKVYFDEGVGRAPLGILLDELQNWGPETICAEAVINGDWMNQTKLFIIPGGRDLEYHRLLQGKGNANIRAFVEEGGTFLGICAGAYYGCKKVEFDKDMPLEVIGDRELGFFPGAGKGPAYGPGTYYYDSERGSHPAHLSESLFAPPFHCYFNGGCYFSEAEAHSSVKILARYLDLENQPAAIIESSIGKGKAILSGVHFEIGASPKNRFRKKIKILLSSHEETRKAFFRNIITYLIGL